MTEEIPGQPILDSALRQLVAHSRTRGATAEMIEQVRVQQDVAAIPAAVREAWSLIGDEPDTWWLGQEASVHALTAELKKSAVGVHHQAGGGLRDAAGMLVLLAEGVDEFHVIDGTDLGVADPPVWLLLADHSPEKAWPTVTAWFTSSTIGALELRTRILRLRAGAVDSFNA